MGLLSKTIALCVLLLAGACGGALMDAVEPGDTKEQSPGGAATETECPERDDPSVHYVNPEADPEVCLAMFFSCNEDQTLFSNECGCGCIDQEPLCPSRDDPAVHYMNPEGDPEACLAMFFGCDEDQTLFSNECGCGCLD